MALPNITGTQGPLTLFMLSKALGHQGYGFEETIDSIGAQADDIVTFYVRSSQLAQLMNQKEVIAGVIFDPLRDEIFISEKGSGSFVNDRRLRVSARKYIKNAIFSSNLHNADFEIDGKIFTQLERIKKENGNVRFLGAPALDLAYVAAGRLDGLWHNYLDFCQIAAGSLIISEAGGIIELKETSSGEIYRKNILACNAELHTKLLSILN